MEYIRRHELKKISPDSDEYELVIYLDNQSAEFAEELDRVSKSRADLMASTKQLINRCYSNMKITMVKIVIGGLAITTIPLLGAHSSFAAETNPATNSSVNQMVQADSIYYNVSSGDTLWKLSSQYNHQ